MSFDEILSKWEKNNSNIKSSQNKKSSKTKEMTMNALLDKYPPTPEVYKNETSPMPPKQKHRNYKRMKHQKSIDLHGFTKVDAESELDYFFKECKRKKIEKVLIIHGKGLNSPNGESVLRVVVKNILEKSSIIGETGRPSEKDGGSGATWAIIK